MTEWEDLHGEREQEAQQAYLISQSKQPDLTGAEIEELAEVGAINPVLVWRQYENICTHLYIKAEMEGREVYGWWLDGDGAADIRWSESQEVG